MDPLPDRFRHFYEHAPVAMHSIDETSTICDVNLAWLDLLGYSREEILGKPATVVMTPNSARRAVDVHIPEFWKTGQIRRVPYEYVRKDGTILEVELDCNATVDPSGRRISLSVVNDVTERNRTSRALVELSAKLAQADRLATVGMIAAGVAHEINNPLTYLMHFIERTRLELQTARERGAAIEQKQLDAIEADAKTAYEGGLRVRDIVRELKTFGRGDEGGLTTLDVNRTLQSAVQLAIHLVRPHARLNVALGALPVVRAHEGRLCQVLVNLLVNAAQSFSDPDSEEPHRVEVKTWARGDRVFVSVSDGGSGIAPEHLGKLFEPFFSTKPGSAGTGLGLWISREIVHEAGGHLDVETEVGVGSTFTVVLPAADAPEDIATDPPPPPVVPAVARPSTRRILVVEDEPALRVLLSEALSGRAQVVTASNGNEARDLLENDSAFDLILCDLMMPGMGGAELHGWIDEQKPSLAGRVVFMTGAAQSAHARNFLAKVRNEHLDKPFRVRDLERMLDRLLGPEVTIQA